MIGTIETRKVVLVELNRAEVINLLNGAHIKEMLKSIHDDEDVSIDLSIFCSNPICDDPKENEGDDEFWNPTRSS